MLETPFFLTGCLQAFRYQQIKNNLKVIIIEWADDNTNLLVSNEKNNTQVHRHSQPEHRLESI